MKKIFTFILLSVITSFAYAQVKETFDLVTYTPLKGWKKQSAEIAVQFTKQNSAKGTYCLITLYKAIPGVADSKENFDLAWETLVKETVTVTAAPEMQPADTKNGWEVQSGYAAFEKEDMKGVVVLVTASVFEKMVNIVILTNTDVYEKNVTSFLNSVSLKKLAAGNQGTANLPSGQPNINKTESPGSTPAPVSNGFAFTTTNFDDGWTSTVQEDWVQAIKGDIKVLLHYPTNMNAANSDVNVMCAAAWNVFVAPRYSSMENYQITPGVSDSPRPYFAQANLTDNTTGKKVFVALFKKGDSGWIEIIAPDKNSFIQNFGLDISKIDYYIDSKIWDPLLKLTNYNKFAVAASDFKGKWSNNFAAMHQYVNVYTGADAGTNTYSAAETFEFGAGNSYKWELKVASGFVGNIKFQGAKSSGKLSVPNNWQVYFSEIEKKPKTYNAYFSCIKGARLLWLQNTDYGDYNSFGKVE